MPLATLCLTLRIRTFVPRAFAVPSRESESEARWNAGLTNCTFLGFHAWAAINDTYKLWQSISETESPYQIELSDGFMSSPLVCGVGRSDAQIGAQSIKCSTGHDIY